MSTWVSMAITRSWIARATATLGSAMRSELAVAVATVSAVCGAAQPSVSTAATAAGYFEPIIVPPLGASRRGLRLHHGPPPYVRSRAGSRGRVALRGYIRAD